MKGLRIGLVCHRYPPYTGGLERHVEQLKNGLKHRDIQATVFTSRYSGFDRGNGVVEFNPILIPGSGYFFWPSFTASHVRSELSRIDIIHAFDVSMFSAVCGLYWSLAFEKPCVLTSTYHPPEFTVHKAARRAYDSIVMKRILKRYDRIIVHSDVEANAILQNFPQVSRDTIVKLEHTTNITNVEAREEPLRPALGLDNSFVVLSVGRIDSIKGFGDVMEAGKILGERGIDTKIIHIGPPESWFDSGNSNPVKNQNFVTFLGRVNESMLKSAYLGSDVTVISSRYETFSLVAIESLMLGTPIVTTNTGIMPEIVKDGLNGHFYKAGNAVELADKLESLYRRTRHTRQGTNEPLISEEEFGRPEREIDRLISLYEELIDGH